MVDTLADHADTMVDDQPTVLPEQGQKMCQHTPWSQPPACAPGCGGNICFSPPPPLCLAGD
jgi:hypothetical protein